MKKPIKLIMCLMLVAVPLVTLSTSASYAKTAKKQIEKKEDMVYATKRGKKYHRADCPFVAKREKISMTLEEAQAKGLKPCGRCMGSDQDQAKK